MEKMIYKLIGAPIELWDKVEKVSKAAGVSRNQSIRWAAERYVNSPVKTGFIRVIKRTRKPKVERTEVKRSRTRHK